MSGGNDNPFARWSRRKLAARSDKSNAVPETQQPEDEAAAHIDTDAPSLPFDPDRPEAAEAEAADAAAPLPCLEDLTAESNLTAFLKKGVPSALKSAALRKMWSLDPGIRDYVGPSEYAWDFNQPGSMAGFGSLDAKETVVGFLSKTVHASETDAKPTAAMQPPDALPERSADASPDGAAEAEATEPAPAGEPLQSNPPAGVADTADAASGEPGATDREHSPDAAGRSQISGQAVRPRHGGAMPR